jgi:hypothetical protein
MLRIVLFTLAFGLAAINHAAAEYEPQECRGFFPNGQTKDEFLAAVVKLDKCQRNFMGVVSIDQQAAARESVVRAYIDRGERALPLFIEYVLADDGHAWLDVRTLSEKNPRLVASISDESFLAVQSRWEARNEIGAEDKAKYNLEKVTEEKRGIETVCIPAGGGTIETAKAGHVERVGLGGCDKPWEFQFVDFLYAHALKDAGDCAERYRDGSDDERLMHCMFEESGRMRGLLR